MHPPRNSSLHRFAMLVPWRALVLVAVAYLATLVILEPHGFWVVDNANKFLQLRGIMANHYRDYAIPWPGQAIDPGLQYNPLPYAFSEIRGGRIYSIFSPVFATLSSIPYRLFGFRGLYLLPCLASLFTLVAMASFQPALGRPGRGSGVAILIAGLCTPLWFYSVTFWEHTLSVCAGMWAVYFFASFLYPGHGTRARTDFLRGTALAALAVYFRDDMLPFCVAALGVVVAHAKQNRPRLLLLGSVTMIVTWIPLWIFQWWAIGAPFGFHLEKHLTVATSLTEHLIERPRVLYNLLIASGLPAWPSGLLAVPWFLAVALRPLLPGKAGLRWMAAACLVAVAASGLVLRGYASGRPVHWMDVSNSLFNTTPVLILAFLRPHRDGRRLRFLRHVALAFVVAYCLSAPAFGTVGVHWGCRYLLLVYPFLALLAGVHAVGWWERREDPTEPTREARRPGAGLRLARAAFLLTVLVSFAAQLYSIDVLRRKKEFSRRLNETLLRRTENVVITDVPWVAQECFDIFYDRDVFVTLTSGDLLELLHQLELRGTTEVLFLSQTEQDLPAPQAIVDAPGLDYFTLYLFNLTQAP